MEAREVTLTVPLSITVRIGDGPDVSSVSGTYTTELAEEAARQRSYYQGYKGYDPDFLDIAVPLPELTDEQRRNAAKNSDAAAAEDPTVLPYTHLSAVMNRPRDGRGEEVVVCQRRSPHQPLSCPCEVAGR